MRKILSYFIIVFAFFPFYVSAFECSSNDRERLQKMANNISVTLEERNIDGVIYFDATVAGVSKEIRLYDQAKFIYYRNITENDINEIIFEKLRQGKTYTYNVVGDSTCENYNFRTIRLSIPVYNIYYDEPICENAKTYKLCQKWYDNSNLSYEDFKSKVKSYIQNNTTESLKSNDSDGNDDLYLQFINFYDKYYYVLLSSLIICLSILIYLWIRINKKNRL